MTLGAANVQCSDAMGRIHVGTAGWAYKDWEGVLYPKPHPRAFDPLTFLSRYIDVVEVNSTFYRPVDPDVARRWIDRVSTPCARNAWTAASPSGVSGTALTIRAG